MAKESLTNAQAARLLGVSPGAVGRLSQTFPFINERVDGRIHWRGDVIRRASEFKAQGVMQSVKRLIERAIKEAKG